MHFFNYAVEIQGQSMQQTHFELQWAQNGARIQSKNAGAAFVWGITDTGVEVLLEAWVEGERYGRYRPAA